MAFDDTDLPWIQLFEPVQRLVECEEVVDAALGGSDRLVQHDVRGAAAPLLCPARLCVIDEHAPHRASGDRKKMDAILPGDACQAQTKVSLVHQRGRVERVPGSLAFELTMGHPLQLAVHQREKLVLCAPLAHRHLSKEFRDCGLSQASVLLCRAQALMRDAAAISRFTG